MSKYCTVVYCIRGDRAALEAWWETIHPMLWNGDPVSITAFSQADDLTRLDCIHYILSEPRSHDAETIEAIKRILAHPDPYVWWKENAKPPPEPSEAPP